MVTRVRTMLDPLPGIIPSSLGLQAAPLATAWCYSWQHETSRCHHLGTALLVALLGGARCSRLDNDDGGSCHVGLDP